MISDYAAVATLHVLCSVVTLWLFSRIRGEFETWKAIRRGEDALLCLPAGPVVRANDTLLERAAYLDATMGVGEKLFLVVAGPMGTILTFSALPDLRACIADARKRVLELT